MDETDIRVLKLVGCGGGVVVVVVVVVVVEVGEAELPEAKVVGLGGDDWMKMGAVTRDCCITEAAG